MFQWLSPDWEQGAVASHRRPAPQGCLKESAAVSLNTLPVSMGNGKELVPNNEQIFASRPDGSFHRFAVPLPPGGRQRVQPQWAVEQ